MNEATKKLLIETAKDALLEIVELVAEKVAESARNMRTKEMGTTPKTPYVDWEKKQLGDTDGDISPS